MRPHSPGPRLIPPPLLLSMGLVVLLELDMLLLAAVVERDILGTAAAAGLNK